MVTKATDDILENRPPKFKSPTYINTYRSDMGKERIVLEFGHITEKEEKEIVDVVASLSLDPTLIKHLISYFIAMGLKYQDKFDIDIGIPKPNKSEKK